MDIKNPSINTQQKLDIFFNKCTISFRDHDQYTIRDIHKIIREKQNNDIRHFCQELINDAEYRVENQCTFTGNEMTVEEYLVHWIKEYSK